MKQLQVLQSEMLPLKSLKANTGQIPGLPANPRSIDATRLAKLKESLKQNPEMLALREILVFKYEGENVVIGGNQRIAALQGMGVKDVPCKIIPSDTTAEQLRAYLIKDNVEFGSWVDEMLGKDWDMSELDDFGMEDVARLDMSDVKKVETNVQTPTVAENAAKEEMAPVKRECHSRQLSETENTPNVSEHIGIKPEPVDISSQVRQPSFDSALPPELQGVDMTPAPLEKIQGEDNVVMDRIIIVYPKGKKEDVLKMLGVTNFNKVVYSIDELNINAE